LDHKNSIKKSEGLTAAVCLCNLTTGKYIQRTTDEGGWKTEELDRRKKL